MKTAIHEFKTNKRMDVPIFVNSLSHSWTVDLAEEAMKIVKCK